MKNAKCYGAIVVGVLIQSLYLVQFVVLYRQAQLMCVAFGLNGARRLCSPCIMDECNIFCQP